MTSLLLLAAALSPVVGGSTTCPAPAQVSAALDALGAAREGRVRSVELRESATGVRATLRLHDDEPIVREVPASGACDDRARALAIVVAAAQATLDGGAPAVVVLARPAPFSVTTPPLRVATKDLVLYDVSASFAATWAERDFAPAGELALRVASMRRGLGARVAGFGGAEHVEALAGGEVRWLRAGASLGPSYRIPLGRAAALDVHTEVALAALRLAGAGFAANHTITSFEPGVGTGLRAVVPWRFAAAVVELAVRGWPTAPLAVLSSGKSLQLPVVETQLTVGLAFGRFHDRARKDLQ
jgi:hypothetical protein